MKTNQVEVSIGRTVNLGNYESLRLDFTIREEVDDAEMAETAIDKLRDRLRAHLVTAIRDEVEFIQHGQMLVDKAEKEASGPAGKPNIKPSGRNLNRG